MEPKGIGHEKPFKPQSFSLGERSVGETLQEGMGEITGEAEAGTTDKVEISSAAYVSPFGKAREAAAALHETAKRMAMESPEFKELIGDKEIRESTEKYLASIWDNPKARLLTEKFESELKAKEKSAFEADPEAVGKMKGEVGLVLLFLLGYVAGKVIFKKQ